MEDVTRLVSSGDDVKVWNSASMTLLEQFNPHSARHPVSRVCWSSNNRYLVTASSSGDKLVVSSLKSSPIPLVELGEGRKQTRISLNSTSQFLVSGGLDCTVNIWDLKTKKLHRSLQDHKEEVTCVSFNGNDNYIASGSTSGDIVLHSITTNLSSKPFGHGAIQPIHDLKYSFVKRSLLGTVSDSGVVVLWDANTQKELHSFPEKHKAPASGLAFSPTSDLLFVTVGLDKKIICYDTSSKMVLRSMRADSPLTAIDFTPDGAGLAVGSTQGKVYLYDLRNLSAPVNMAIAHKTSVTCLSFQHIHSRHTKSSKVGSSKTSFAVPSKRTSVKQEDPAGPDPTPVPSPCSAALTFPTSTVTQHGLQAVSDQHVAEKAGGGMDVVPREEDEGQQSGDRLPSMDRFNSVGRNSLDIFSPVREDYKALRLSVDPSSGKKKDELDFLSQYARSTDPRRIPLGTPGSIGPSSVFQTPPPIREEETSPLALPQIKESRTGDKDLSAGLTLELDRQAVPSSTGPSARTPEAALRSGRDGVAPLCFDTPVNGATPVAARKPPGVEAVASSLTERITESVADEGGGAPLSALQVHFIRNMIHEALEDFRDACHRDIVNLQVEMIRQFYIQLNEIHGLIEKYSVTDSLVEEIERLKEENKRLRTNY
ncbi:protein NEDD1 [Paramormyrops kingsleyae]|uniref:protein NEDD1 n=1 Tax=Paramormyrops kingsleyae TaxID=1676925 RepID=UPI003B97732A